MRVNNSLVGAALMFAALGSAACGSDDNTGVNPATTQGGTGAIGASAGATAQPAAGSGTATAGSKASGAAGASTVAGRGAAGSTPATAGTGTPAAAGSGAAGSGTPATAGSGMAAAGSGAGGAPATGGTGAMAGAGAAGSSGAPAAGSTGMMGMGSGKCCMGGDCLCHGDPPSAPTAEKGPFMTAMYTVAGVGCVYYPMNAEPPFAAVAVSDGFTGSGGCGSIQTGQWGPLYASWGIVGMIINTGASDQPAVRGQKLTAAIAAFKSENMKDGSPLKGKLSGRYGTSGFSMGGGGTCFSAMKDPTLKSNVAIMAWAPATSGITVPSLFIFGSSDTLAGTMGMSAYRSISGMVPKMAVTVPSGHAGQPTSGQSQSGRAGLAWQKVYLEGDERWKPVLKMVMSTEKANVD